MTTGHRHPDGLRAPHPERARWAAAGGVALLVATGVSAAAIAYNDPPLTYEWATPSEVSEPTARGGPIQPPGPLLIPSIGASGAYDPDATSTPPAPAQTSTTPRCSRCGERTAAASTPAPTSSTVAAPPVVQPPPEPEPTATPAQAATIGLLELVNAARADHGCGPVSPHPDLAAASQAHAEQQAADDNMHHSNGGADWRMWAENVAYGPSTANDVHQAWMSSPLHRANVLNCDYTHMGAGAADTPSGRRYWTEQFGAP